MRYYPLIIAFFFVTLFAGCKKDNIEPKQSMAELFKDKAWSGMIKYTSRDFHEPYYVKFDTSNFFQWSEVSGTYSGTYTLAEDTRTIKLLFSGGSHFTMKIGDDNKCSVITHGGSYPWTVEDGEINNSSSDNIDNSVWSGITATRFSPPEGDTTSFQFQPSNKIVFPGFITNSYTRNGAAIRVVITASMPHNYFFVINKNKIKGFVLYAYTSPPPFVNLTGKFELTKK